MNYLTCPHCGETYRNITAVHVCSSGPYAVKLPADTNINTKERIRELAQQAGFIVSAPTLNPTLEKFAELIVQECADICINKNVSILDINVIRESGKFTLQDLATKSCCENLSKQIKKHFGVEE